MYAYFRSLSMIFIVFLALLSAGCDVFSSSSDDEGGIVTLTGQILNAETNNPVPGAFIRVLPYDLLFEAGSDGSYSVEVEIDSTMDLSVTATADGFSPSTLPVLALPDRTIQVPPFVLKQTATKQATSGQAASLIMLSQSGSTIGVKESGSEEIATLVFQLADSLGNPIVLAQKAQVSFRFGLQPGGGEFLSPATVLTDNNGLATVSLASGTKAGVVQILAESTVNGRVLRSQPVAMTIHGGLPDQAHFSLGPQRRNFPGLNAFGLNNLMSVIVGDKYSNPVRQGTAVYFDTSHGVIEGSTNTNQTGQGSANLMSANPLPANGIVHVRAFTANDQQNAVSSLTPVVFSGTPVITVNPGTAALNQTYNYSVTDYNGNPLVEGTRISVEVQGTAVKAVGHTSITLDDTAFMGGVDYEHVVRGSGITEFTFRIVENIDPLNPEVPSVEVITIKSSGGNGTLEIVMGASGAPYSRTANTEVHQASNGQFRFELSDPDSKR